MTSSLPGPHSGRRVFALVGPVVRRPDLWWTALGTLVRQAPESWWKSPPYLPLPDRRIWEFRMVTAYGRPDAVPESSDVISFLEWSRATAGSGHPSTHGHR